MGLGTASMFDSESMDGKKRVLTCVSHINYPNDEKRVYEAQDIPMDYKG
jgi:hypothetical protein